MISSVISKQEFKDEALEKTDEGSQGEQKSRRTDSKGPRQTPSLPLSLCLPWMISGWNKAGHWLDSSVHRFKFRLDETRRLVTRPHSLPASNFWKPLLTTLSFLLTSQGIRRKGGGGGIRPPSIKLEQCMKRSRDLSIPFIVMGSSESIFSSMCFRI